jgi:hypothetical protein
LKNENHQAQIAYMKTMSQKNGIPFSDMNLSDFVDKTTAKKRGKQKIEVK